MREKLKNKFAVVDASQITAWEAVLRNGMMTSNDKDTEKKFHDLEERQNYLCTQRSSKNSMSLAQKAHWQRL
jgi:hypothetical protein